jgi:hypothetical protein
MSLAMSAAPFNESNDETINSLIEKKRTLSHNKTQKRYDSTSDQRVKYALEEIHDKTSDSDDANNLGDFSPPPPPISSGVEKTEEKAKGQDTYRVTGKPPRPVYEHEDELAMNNFKSAYGNSKNNDEYYNKVIPGYKQQTIKSSYEPQDNDTLLKKINYMINLLEEQQDERTNNVTEEVVLYSFLGIFIIFIVDSFAKTGKYVR